VQRVALQNIKNQLFRKKVILLVGARQVGKTTILKQLVAETAAKSIWLNADEGDIRQALDTAQTSTQLMQLFGENELVIIDEAQQIKDIGLKLKLVIDTNPHIQIIATGSSAFELLQKSNEPLTGRKVEMQLFPFSFAELAANSSEMEEKRLLATRLVYGSYPEVVNNPGREKEVLTDLVSSYLYKDLLRYEGIKKSSVLEKLVLALALQTGHEVSYHELGKTLGNINPATIEKYIDLLEKAFVVYKLPALSRNLRTELKKGKKIYFYDNGVRNCIISNYMMPELRQDKGALWENYIMGERLKYIHTTQHHCNRYFWRTFDQAEIDYIEEYDGALHAYEFKWKTNRKKLPASFMQNYTVAETGFIDTDNYTDFIKS
jgi:uncharacterized protein